MKLPPIETVYNELRKEERRNKIREQRSKHILEEIELAEEANQIYRNQTLIHRMDEYLSSEGSEIEGDLGDEDNGPSLIPKDDDSDTTEFDEEQMRNYFLPTEDLVTKEREEKLGELLSKYKKERKKEIKRREQHSVPTRSVTSFGDYSTVNHRDQRHDRRMRSKTELGFRARDVDDFHDRTLSAKPMEILMDKDMLRPYRTKKLTLESVLQPTAEMKDRNVSPKKQNLVTKSVLDSRHSSPNSKILDRSLSTTPLPPTSLYLKERPLKKVNSHKLVLRKKSSSPPPSVNYPSQILTNSFDRSSLTQSFSRRLFADEVFAARSPKSHPMNEFSQFARVDESFLDMSSSQHEPLVGVTHSQAFDGKSNNYHCTSRDVVLSTLREKKKKGIDVHTRLYPKTVPFKGPKVIFKSNEMKLHEVWEYWEDYKHKYRPNYHRKVTAKFGPGGKPREYADRLPKISLVPVESGFQSFISEGSSSEEDTR